MPSVSESTSARVWFVSGFSFFLVEIAFWFLTEHDADHVSLAIIREAYLVSGLR
jgi:hypothetical protein